MRKLEEEVYMSQFLETKCHFFSYHYKYRKHSENECYLTYLSVTGDMLSKYVSVPLNKANQRTSSKSLIMSVRGIQVSPSYKSCMAVRFPRNAG